MRAKKWHNWRFKWLLRQYLRPQEEEIRHWRPPEEWGSVFRQKVMSGRQSRGKDNMKREQNLPNWRRRKDSSSHDCYSKWSWPHCSPLDLNSGARGNLGTDGSQLDSRREILLSKNRPTPPKISQEGKRGIKFDATVIQFIRAGQAGWPVARMPDEASPRKVLVLEIHETRRLGRQH